MRIETKFDIDQKVFFMSDNRVQSDEIISLNVDVLRNHEEGGELTIIEYMVGYRNKGFHEDELFATKQELLDSL